MRQKILDHHTFNLKKVFKQTFLEWFLQVGFLKSN